MDPMGNPLITDPSIDPDPLTSVSRHHWRIRHPALLPRQGTGNVPNVASTILPGPVGLVTVRQQQLRLNGWFSRIFVAQMVVKLWKLGNDEAWSYLPEDSYSPIWNRPFQKETGIPTIYIYVHIHCQVRFVCRVGKTFWKVTATWNGWLENKSLPVGTAIFFKVRVVLTVIHEGGRYHCHANLWVMTVKFEWFARRNRALLRLQLWKLTWNQKITHV